MDGTDTDGQLDTVATFANPHVPFSRAGVAERHTWPSPGKSNLAHQILELRTFQWCHFEHTPSPRSWNGNLLNWISMYMQQHAYACLVRSSVKFASDWNQSIVFLPQALTSFRALGNDLIGLIWLDGLAPLCPIDPICGSVQKRSVSGSVSECLRWLHLCRTFRNPETEGLVAFLCFARLINFETSSYL